MAAPFWGLAVAVLSCALIFGNHFVGVTMNQFDLSSHQSTTLAAIAERGQRIAVISASWHADIVSNGTTALLDSLDRYRWPRKQLDQFAVPGAFEIPLHAQRLAQTGRYAAIVACGLVVDGGIYRHEFVTSAVIDGLMRVQLDTGVPVFSMVLTPKDFHEHQDHLQFYRAHFVKKGQEAAWACVQTLVSLAAPEFA